MKPHLFLVIRGGTWKVDADICFMLRTAYPGGNNGSNSSTYAGFRSFLSGRYAR